MSPLHPTVDRKYLLDTAEGMCEFIAKNGDTPMPDSPRHSLVAMLRLTGRLLTVAHGFNHNFPAACPLTGDDELAGLIACRATLIRRLRKLET